MADASLGFRLSAYSHRFDPIHFGTSVRAAAIQPELVRNYLDAILPIGMSVALRFFISCRKARRAFAG